MYAGIGRWAMLLPPSIQVCPVEIPGRGRREGEPAPSDAAELARVLAHSLPLQVQTTLFRPCSHDTSASLMIFREDGRSGARASAPYDTAILEFRV